MGDCKIAATGNLVVTIDTDKIRDSNGTDVSDACIGMYLSKLADLQAQMEGYDQYTKIVNIRHFNYSYCLGRDIRVPIGPPVSAIKPMRVDLSTFDDSRKSYLKEVIDFCLTSDIVSKLGLTVEDYMNMDLDTFGFVKKAYQDYKPKEQQAASDVLRDMERDLKKL